MRSAVGHRYNGSVASSGFVLGSVSVGCSQAGKRPSQTGVPMVPPLVQCASAVVMLSTSTPRAGNPPTSTLMDGDKVSPPHIARHQYRNPDRNSFAAL